MTILTNTLAKEKLFIDKKGDVLQKSDRGNFEGDREDILEDDKPRAKYHGWIQSIDDVAARRNWTWHRCIPRALMLVIALIVLFLLIMNFVLNVEILEQLKGQPVRTITTIKDVSVVPHDRNMESKNKLESSKEIYEGRVPKKHAIHGGTVTPNTEGRAELLEKPVTLVDKKISNIVSESTKGIPKVSQAKGIPEVSQVKGIPEVSQTNGIAEVSQANGIPEVGQTIGIPEVSQTKGIPEVSQANGIPDVGQTNGIPGVSQTKSIPEVSQAKGIPEVSQAKGIPEVSQAKGIPEVSQAKGIPEVSQAKGIPEVSQAKGIPEVSQAKGIPELGQIKDVLVDRKKFGNDLKKKLEIPVTSSTGKNTKVADITNDGTAEESDKASGTSPKTNEKDQTTIKTNKKVSAPRNDVTTEKKFEESIFAKVIFNQIITDFRNNLVAKINDLKHECYLERPKRFFEFRTGRSDRLVITDQIFRELCSTPVIEWKINAWMIRERCWAYDIKCVGSELPKSSENP